MDNKTRVQSRKEALEKLEALGIKGRYIYLLDMIPLIEIAWADGRIQEMELILLQEFLRNHVEKINHKAGSQVFSYKEAADFLTGFLKERPSRELLAALRELVNPARFDSRNDLGAIEEKMSILKFCLDIAAAATTSYPYNSHERFDESEKKIFLNILKSMNIPMDRPWGDNI